MALTATLAIPKSPEIWPLGGGKLAEVYTVTGDGSDVDVVVTSSALRRIMACIAGSASTDITTATANSFTLTYPTAIGNGLTLQILVIGVQ